MGPHRKLLVLMLASVRCILCAPTVSVGPAAAAYVGRGRGKRTAPFAPGRFHFYLLQKGSERKALVRSSAPSVAQSSLRRLCHGQSGTQPSSPIECAPAIIALDAKSTDSLNGWLTSVLYDVRFDFISSMDPAQLTQARFAYWAHSPPPTECAQCAC